MSFVGKQAAATDADIVAGRHRQRIHHIFVVGVARFEKFAQHRQQRMPKIHRQRVQATVKLSFAQASAKITVLMQKFVAFFHVPAEIQSRHQRHRHHFGARNTRLLVIAVLHDLQEVVTQTVDRGYGIFHCVFSWLIGLEARQSGEYYPAL